MGKDKKQTTTQRLDPRSQGYVNQMREQARSSADMILNNPDSFFTGPSNASVSDMVQPFLNPYIQDVIGGLGQEYDQRRAAATTGANQAATAAGAFNSARHGVREGTQLAELDRAQMQQTAGLLSDQWNRALSSGMGWEQYNQGLRAQRAMEPVWRAQQAQGITGAGLGPTGSTTTNIQKGNFLKDAMGLGMMGASLFSGGATGLLGTGATAFSRGSGPAQYTYMDDLNRPNLSWQ